MKSSDQTEQVLVIPCSGIGKVFGLLSREVVYRVTDTLLPNKRIRYAWPCWSPAMPKRSKRFSKRLASPSMAVRNCAP